MEVAGRVRGGEGTPGRTGETGSGGPAGWNLDSVVNERLGDVEE